MGVIHSISTIKSKLEVQLNMCMFLGSAQNHTCDKYRMLNLHIKNIILLRDDIWLNKIYGGYVSIKENTRADTYILKY